MPLIRNVNFINNAAALVSPVAKETQIGVEFQPLFYKKAQETSPNIQFPAPEFRWHRKALFHPPVLGQRMADPKKSNDKKQKVRL